MTELLKPRLLPIPLPWRVSASHELIGITATEETAGVLLLAFFGNQLAEKEIAALEAVGDTNDAKYNRAGFANVYVTFSRLGELRLLPQLGESGLFDAARFDMSAVPGYKDSTSGSSVPVWQPDELCPNPRFYEVVQSNWLPHIMGGNPSLRHWLLLGHSAVLEVAAEVMTWRRE